MGLVLAACGGDDTSGSSLTTVDVSTQASSASTTVSNPDVGGDAELATMPDACGLIDDSTAAAAMGGAGTKAAPQPPTEISARCEWTSGDHSISLLVRQGPTADENLRNAGADFAPAHIAGGEAVVRLGVDEKDRNYRLVTFLAFDGRYFISVSLQGPSRDDASATDAAADLVGEAKFNLN